MEHGLYFPASRIQTNSNMNSKSVDQQKTSNGSFSSWIINKLRKPNSNHRRDIHHAFYSHEENLARIWHRVGTSIEQYYRRVFRQIFKITTSTGGMCLLLYENLVETLENPLLSEHGQIIYRILFTPWLSVLRDIMKKSSNIWATLVGIWKKSLRQTRLVLGGPKGALYFWVCSSYDLANTLYTTATIRWGFKQSTPLYSWQYFGKTTKASTPTSTSHVLEYLGLLCSHNLLILCQNKSYIRLENIHPRWFFDCTSWPTAYLQPSVILDPLLVARRRGRPRAAGYRQVLGNNQSFEREEENKGNRKIGVERRNLQQVSRSRDWRQDRR